MEVGAIKHCPGLLLVHRARGYEHLSPEGVKPALTLRCHRFCDLGLASLQEVMQYGSSGKRLKQTLQRDFTHD